MVDGEEHTVSHLQRALYTPSRVVAVSKVGPMLPHLLIFQENLEIWKCLIFNYWHLVQI